MEKKLKFSEFADLIGTTAKTVYKMDERGEIKTVNEKVNNRLIKLVVTDDEQIKNFRLMYRKNTFNNGNYEDILTDNNRGSTVNEPSQISNNNDKYNDLVEKILTLNEEYNNRLEKKNNELLNVQKELMKYENQQYLLEEKCNREGLYLSEINQLKTDNEGLLKSRNLLLKLLITVIIILGMLLTSILTVNIVNNAKKSPVKQIQMENA